MSAAEVGTNEAQAGVIGSLFAPASVVIVGASSDPAKYGGRVLRYLLDHGYTGRIYPVNASGGTVQGLPAFASVDELPDGIDQALIMVAPAACVAALRACAAKGVRLAQVFSAGFAEEGERGLALQDELLAIARAHGMRLLGPNCMGLISPRSGYFATFTSALRGGIVPTPGVVAIATQSGALGSCAYSMAAQRGLGISHAISTGNEADIDVAQCIAWLADDPQTRVICAALEGCTDGQALRRALTRAARAGKPVIMLKLGASALGSAAAATHTGSLAGHDAVYDAVLAECGAWRARSIEEMLDIAELAAAGGLPPNRQIAIVSMSGGIGVLAADVADRLGLELPPFDAAVAARLRAALPLNHVANPLDLTGRSTAVADSSFKALEALLEGCDCGTVFCYLSQRMASATLFARDAELFASLKRRFPQRCLVLVGPPDEALRRALLAAGLVVFADPSRALAAVHAAAVMQQRQAALLADETLDATAVRPMASATFLPDGCVSETAAKALLAAYGVPSLAESLCVSIDAALQAAAAWGGPVAVKIVSPDITHKTEIGGVVLDVAGADALRAAYEGVLARARAAFPAARIEGVLVSPMARDGVEVIVGALVDPVFGPMVMCGLGGTMAELFADVAWASAPLTTQRARAMLDGLKVRRLLAGWRGAPPRDIDALVAALVGVGRLAAEHADQLASLDINPLLVMRDGVVCLDALLTLS